jgi:hypothetical protein
MKKTKGPIKGIQMETDLAVWLKDKSEVLGDVLPRSLLQEGFVFESDRVPLVSPQGIFKPRLLELPLSITTTPEGPYKDAFGSDGYCQLKQNFADPTAACWGLRLSEYHKWWPFSSIFT